MKSNRFGSGVVSKGVNDILSPNTSHLIDNDWSRNVFDSCV